MRYSALLAVVLSVSPPVRPSACLAQVPAANQARVAWVHNPRVANSTWVSDAAHHLQPATVASLNELIGALERETGTEIAVVVVDSLAGLTEQEFATTLHRFWGVGKADRDNGILFLWAPRDRKIFLSIGHGLEGVIPDRRAGRIRDQQIFAAFRANRFDDGVLAGVQALAAAAREETNPRIAAPRAGNRLVAPSEDRGIPGPLRLFGSLAGLAAAGIGGLFGYRRWQRRKPRNCTNGHPMRRLSDAEEIGKLDKGAQLEQRIGSVDWDVWVCDTCAETHRYAYNRGSKWSVCDKCGHRTMKSIRTVIDEPTTLSEGQARITKICQNCGHKTTKDEIIPRVVVSSSSSDSSSGGGWSGDSGGGGGSFGGGSAGGGGAGGSY